MLQKIKNDFKINSFRSGWILFEYRCQHYIYSKNFKFKKLYLNFFKIIFGFTNIILNINSQIALEAIIGKNIRLPHSANGVIISSKAIIEDNVTIFQQVTLGVNDRKDISEQKIVIKKGSYISTGAKIINCIIGENVIVAPNTFINEDIEDNTAIFPSKIIKKYKFKE